MQAFHISMLENDIYAHVKRYPKSEWLIDAFNECKDKEPIRCSEDGTRMFFFEEYGEACYGGANVQFEDALKKYGKSCYVDRSSEGGIGAIELLP
jgi:hypothetical protein